MVATESEGKRADAQQDLATTEEILEFTGNWFIDAGILGFVNLMEEVYGWDLHELRRRIREAPDIVYYGFFPFGYLMYHSRIRTVRGNISTLIEEINKKNEKLKESEIALEKLLSTRKENALIKKQSTAMRINKKIENEKEKIDNFEKEIKKYKNEISKEEDNLNIELKKFKENLEREISTIIYNVERKKEDINSLISDFDLKLPKDHRNFFIYNSKEVKGNLFNSFVYIWYLLKENYDGCYKFVSSLSKKKKNQGLTYEIIPDSTINPFLYSPDQFPNIGFTNLPDVSTIRTRLNLKQPLYLLLLSFGNAFQVIGGTNVMFYSQSLESSYEINKKLAKYRERLGKKTSLLQITWYAIIDTLFEKKADLSLENMYLIEFSEIKHLKLKGVEYIGIPKLQAAIIIDDTVRENLNKRIQYRIIKKDEYKYKQYSWLIMDFIKGRSLFPIILGHTRLAIGPENLWFSMNASLYALAVEANVKKIRGSTRIFGDDIFRDQYGNITQSIKNDIRYMSMATGAMDKLYPDEDEKKSLRNELFSAVVSRDKNAFLNILVKSLNEKTTNKDIVTLLKYNYINKILKDDQTWEYYALPLVFGLITKTSEREEGESHGVEGDNGED